MNYNKIIDELLKSRTQLLAHILSCGNDKLLSIYIEQIKGIDKLILSVMDKYAIISSDDVDF